MAANELAPLTRQEDVDFLAEDRIVRNTARPAQECMAALERIYERKLWRGRFKSFDDYCKQRFDRSSSYMRRLIKFEKVKTVPIGTIIKNEAQHRALIGFRSELQDEIIARVTAEADGKPITAALIERIGRAVQDEREPRIEEPMLPKGLNEYEGEDDEEAVTNEEVLQRVNEQTATPRLHPILRSANHHRLGRKDSRKAVRDDMKAKALHKAAKDLRDDLRAEADWIDKELLS